MGNGLIRLKDGNFPTVVFIFVSGEITDAKIGTGYC